MKIEFEGFAVFVFVRPSSVGWVEVPASAPQFLARCALDGVPGLRVEHEEKGKVWHGWNDLEGGREVIKFDP